jgi:hypothetical protein
MKWSDAVWRAIQREADATTGLFTRQGLILHQLDFLKSVTGTGGASPAQTLSRELQELRDAGAILFVGRGQYQLARSTADAPSFDTAILTQREQLVQARVGQGKFRSALERRFGAGCPLTGIVDRPLLRASHIIPWSQCKDERDRHDPDNGLLLSCLWDAAFDSGLVSFDERGRVLLSAMLKPAARNMLLSSPSLTLPALPPGTVARLAGHRKRHEGNKLLPV